MYISNLKNVYKSSVLPDYKNKSVSKTNTAKTYTSKNNFLTAYPQNYYLSFKGEQIPEEKQKFLDLLKYHFGCYGNKQIFNGTSEIDIYPTHRSVSPDINKAFREMVSDECFNQPYEKISQEKLSSALKDALDTALYHNVWIDNSDDKQKQQADLDRKTQLILQSYKEKKGIKDENYQFTVDEASNVRYSYYDLEDQIVETDSDLRKRVALSRFITKYCENLEKLKIKIFDEELYEKMKSNLDKEPFSSHWKKLEAIADQRINNNVQSPDEFANDISNDVIEKKITPFANPKFYKYLNATDEKLDIILKKEYGIFSNWYLSEFEKSGIDRKHKSLLVDPGIFNHFEELEQFVADEKIDTKNLEPWELRQKFSEHLGNEVIYRGFYSPDPVEAINKLKNEGNFASAFQRKNEIVNAVKYYIGEINTSNTIFGRISNKIKRQSDYSEFLSVSKLYDVAASVPKWGGYSEEPVIVIKTEIPKLDLIEQDNMFVNMQSSAKHKTLCIGEHYYDYDRRQDEIEAFVPFYLPTDNAEITIDIDTSGFHWC